MHRITGYSVGFNYKLIFQKNKGEKVSERIKVKVDRNSRLTQLPAIALRGLVVFPGNVVHFEVGREKSVAAIEWAMENNSEIFLVTQKDLNEEHPGKADLYSYGVVCDVKQVLRGGEGSVKILVEGKYRAYLSSAEKGGKFLQVSVKPAPLKKAKESQSEQIEALLRSLKEVFEEYLSLNPRLPKDVVYSIFTNEDAMFLADFVPSSILFKYADKQLALNESTLIGRLTRLIELFKRENNIISIEHEIHDKVSDQMDKNQRDYYLREQMRAITDELDDEENTKAEAEKYRAKIESLKLNEEAREKLLKETDRLVRMSGTSQEATVIRTYLDTCLGLPFNVLTLDNLNQKHSEKVLNADHYGLKTVKERILELLAVRSLAPDLKGQILCLVGPPGVGKTSVAKSIARAMGRNYARMSLGGVRDEAEIRGHRRTYIGAMPGKIINAINIAKSQNPLILLDEIDKLASDFRGDPAAALLEALDPEQNHEFRDHYLDIPFDLSQVLFVTTANTLETIPRPLLDRMDVIQLSSYTRNEKYHIAKDHLYKKSAKETGVDGKVRFTDTAYYELIDHYTHEAGVRSLQRSITEVHRKCARKLAAGESAKITVSAKTVNELLGPRRIKPGFFNRHNQVGISNGLAWTRLGGEILPIEVEVIKDGSGRLELTGSLGDVMKESARLAITYSRQVAEVYGYEEVKLMKTDIHIHAPEGAIQKDGPSAGVTLASALISALSGYPVASDFAMTGEITLHGVVLPIGGLKEKSMAAYKEGIKKVIIPKANMPDLFDVDEEVKEHVKFYPVESLEEVLNLVLIIPKKVITDKRNVTAPILTEGDLTGTRPTISQ